MLKIIILLAAVITMSGCASKLTTFDSKGKEKKGIAVAKPVLVEITSETKYEVVPGEEYKKFEKYCTSETKSEYKFLPLGEVYYIGFEASTFGKGEFTIELATSGNLKKVTLNSYASEGIDAVKGILETTLPFITDKKTESEPQAVHSAGAARNDAAKLKKLHCLVKSSTKSIRKVTIQ